MLYRIAFEVADAAELAVAIQMLEDSDLAGRTLDTLKIQVVR
jgi:hypothetical protein